MDKTPEPREGQDTPLEGSIKGLPLLEMLEVLAMGNHTCCVRSPDIGEIYMVMGKPVHARAGDAVGEEAFRLLVQSNPEDFDVVYSRPEQRTIYRDFHSLLIKCVADAEEGADTSKGLFEEINHSDLDQTVARPIIQALENFVEKNPKDVVYVALLDGRARVLHMVHGPTTDPVKNRTDATARFISQIGGIHIMETSGLDPLQEVISSSRDRFYILKPFGPYFLGLCTVKSQDIELPRFLAESLLTQLSQEIKQV